MFILRTKLLAMSPICSKAVLTGALQREYFVLQRLKFALLDDTKLIRKNFENILQKTVKVPKENILTSGSTLQECKFFALEICAKEVDIAIFDQNLEFSVTIM